MEIGKYNQLKILRRTDNGLYLVDGEGREVLLPNKFITPAMKEGDELAVFVYTDSEDRPVATTQQPYAIVGEAAYLQVKDIAKIGAFLDWGLDKDLLLPYSEQTKPLEPGQGTLVFIYQDAASKRVVATNNLRKFIKNKEVHFFPNTEVTLLVCDETPAGYTVAVNSRHWGMLYKNEVFEPINIGDEVAGYVKKVRDDFKIDVALQKQGLVAASDLTGAILEKLKQNNGVLNLGDNSSPAEINAAFGVSKKNFKKAIGLLYKQKKIKLEENRILLA